MVLGTFPPVGNGIRGSGHGVRGVPQALCYLDDIGLIFEWRSPDLLVDMERRVDIPVAREFSQYLELPRSWLVSGAKKQQGQESRDKILAISINAKQLLIKTGRSPRNTTSSYSSIPSLVPVACNIQIIFDRGLLEASWIMMEFVTLFAVRGTGSNIILETIIAQ